MHLNITYHSGSNEEWGASLSGGGGRILCKLLTLSAVLLNLTDIVVINLSVYCLVADIFTIGITHLLD